MDRIAAWAASLSPDEARQTRLGAALPASLLWAEPRAVHGLVQRWLARKSLVRRKGAPSNAFARRYTDEDVDALAEVEREHGRLSGQATAAGAPTETRGLQFYIQTCCNHLPAAG